MATRSRIAIEHQDGTVESIYCHWDGYPTHNGAILNEHYRDRSKVEKLIALGNISSLAPEVEPTGPHSFKNPQYGVVVAYHRDRDDHMSKPRINQSRAGYFRSDIESYGYLFTKEGEWIYACGHTSHRQSHPCSSIEY